MKLISRARCNGHFVYGESISGPLSNFYLVSGNEVVRLLTALRAKVKKFYRVPYCVPAWGWAEHWEIFRCFLSLRIVNGPKKERIYEVFRKYTSAPYVFGFNSGQDAIFAALKAHGIGRGDKVILPSYCCDTVALPVLRCGADPVFCDIGEDFNLDVRHALSLIDPRVRAVIVPHLFGRPAAIDDLEEGIKKIGLRQRIMIIDDAAQSFGAKLHGKLVGTFGDIGIVSFGPGKTLTATGGGLLITRSDEFAKQVTNLGVASVTLVKKAKITLYWLIFRRWRKYSLPFLLRFRSTPSTEIEKRQLPCDLCNVDAAIALRQMKRLEERIHLRQLRANLLGKVLNKHIDNLLVTAPPVDINARNQSRDVYAKYVIRIVPEAFRNLSPSCLYSFFEKHGVEIQDLYTPIHQKPLFRKYSQALFRTEKLTAEVVQIPIEPSINARQFAEIASIVSQCLDSAAKSQICPLRGEK